MDAAVYIATSLDGFIARENGDLDWLMEADPGDEEYGFDTFLSSVDALVMGRNTFDFVLGTGEWAYGEKPVFILTSRELPLPADFKGNVESLDLDPVGVATELAGRGINHVYVDGGETIHSFIRAGLVRRIVITQLPVLIGSGISLFGDLSKDVDLKLIRYRAYDNGWIQIEYEVV